MLNRIALLAAGAMLLIAGTAAAEPRSYPDGHGGRVLFPMGDASFADAVETYMAGDPAPVESASDPEAALGIPDVDEGSERGYLTLGCAGELVVAFEDNVLVDVAGPDFYVFEIGPDVEPTALAVSPDGHSWTRVGRIAGGKAEIELAPYVDADEEFRYVKLVDLKGACGSGRTPGADIDAVGAMGSARRIALDSAVLFDTGAFALKPAAFEAIDGVLASIHERSETSVVVAGHTDAVGPRKANEVLSRNRARAVADYLVAEAGFDEDRVTRQAWGETRPVASNETPEGRARNRRVELTVHMPRSGPRSDTPDVQILGVWDAGDIGVLELRRVDGEVRGDYESDGGRLLGEFTSETVFEGYWIENNSRRACDTEKMGSEHWGPVEITFGSAARDAFESRWRYCGEDEWRGTWARAERLL